MRRGAEVLKVGREVEKEGNDCGELSEKGEE